MILISGSFFTLGAFLYWGTLELMERDIEFRLEGELAAARDLYDRGGLKAVANYIETRQVRDDPFDEHFFLLVDQACRTIASTSEQLDSLCDNMREEDGLYHLVLDRDDAYVLASPFPDGHELLLGAFAIEVESARYLMRRILYWGVLAAIALSLLASIGMALSIERRLEPMNRISREVRLGNLSNRVPLRHTNDEFDRLAANLNEMLDEIQTLLDGIKRVSDTIAHDLRTPLTVLRGHLEDLREEVRDHASEDRVIEALREVDHLLSTFGALLRIAQVEAGSRRAGFAPIDLAGLIAEVVDFYEPLASDRSIALKVGRMDDLRIRGDRDLIFQAVSNLVDNAITYCPEESSIMLGLEGGPGTVRIVVADTGTGIPEEKRDRVLQRFYRMDEHREIEGAGLGLSLVAAVAKLHGGKLRLHDNTPGLRAVLELPAR